MDDAIEVDVDALMDLARDQGTKVVQNIVHGSDSSESAAREIKIFFGN